MRKGRHVERVRIGVTVKRAVVGLVVLIVVLPGLFVVQQAIATLNTLTRVEQERDTWQRPEAILEPLQLRPGITVVDLGSGAGYFALKMAPRVRPEGRVLAVDLRRQPLAFLSIRALLARDWNLHVIRGEADDPGLPPGPIDAVLIANTYHELEQPEPVLRRLFAAMRPGATLVVVDRKPHETEDGGENGAHHHIAAADAERAIVTTGFETVLTDNHFIDRPLTDDDWWLMVFRRR